MESVVSETVAEADKAMQAAGNLDHTLSTGPGLNPGRRKEHREAQTQRETLDKDWGQRVPDYIDIRGADQFRRTAVPAKLAAKGVDFAGVHAKKQAAEQHRATATRATKRATQLARQQKATTTSPGLAAATRHRDELKREAQHRDTLPPDQARAEQAAREQAALERVRAHQAEATANVNRDLNDPTPTVEDNTHEH
ncbi:MAG: hypothetical protein HQ526_10500 [Actinobacteria bacterium]|nr:hypothetical protein [Actinomycetota bacterium]